MELTPTGGTSGWRLAVTLRHVWRRQWWQARQGIDGTFGVDRLWFSVFVLTAIFAEAVVSKLWLCRVLFCVLLVVKSESPVGGAVADDDDATVDALGASC